MTNYGRIKAMSVEEFAEWLDKECGDLHFNFMVYARAEHTESLQLWQEWLESEVELR